MSQPLTLFWPIFAQRSDGKTVVNNKGKPVRNGPTEAQLDRTPNEQGQSDYYRLIEKDDAKHVDWRKKLGGMLLREIGRKEDEDKCQQCILWDFPEGYRLYEHIKSKTNGDSKNHSGGGHDRQDAYVYGYPKGPRKRFRSPLEFFPHLLWLLTDESSDYNNCTCRMCSPNQVEVEKPAQPARSADITSNSPTAMRTMSAPNGPVPVNRNPVPIPIRRSSVGTPITPMAQSPATKPATPTTQYNAGQIKAPPRLEPTPLPQPRTLDQQVDNQYNKFLARTGEVVWFRRPGGAFGLGLIARRWASANGAHAGMYSVQPLSYPGHAPPQEVVEAGADVKPWLAWSVPSCTFEFLRNNPNMGYNQVDWKALAARQWEGHPEVDASILAAKAIDMTYTPFERLKTIPSNGGEERHWNGIYYGAEKIWRGEPVRLRLGLGSDVLVISEIIQKVAPIGNNQVGSKTEMRGDVYAYATLPAPNPKSPPALPTNNHVPLRMRDDMNWRNQTLLPSAGELCYWKLISANQRVALEDIKGRWYEISSLFQQFFFESVQKKEGGNGSWMNARGDATGQSKDPGALRADRLEAFGSAIPQHFRLIDGLDPPSDHEKPATAMQGIELGMGAATVETNFAIDDFMNFGEDTTMPFGDSNIY
ncbi:hypothetical protein PMIN06_005269 [Paraphaeosphaeria minitans]|uniref:Transcription-silencing protein Clr2 n=1 Tax=Paraphaeosphaeria minitans TaxID=565426 RepID=A0A9P6GPM2_9PLEO|nr:hypothetical protein PMIN01_01878 [Paraphaeosphaeria minitans]